MTRTIETIKSYLRNNLTSVSILVNTLLGGECYQSFSARSWERARTGKRNAVRVIDWLMGDENHCVEAWVWWRTSKRTSEDGRDRY